jgi:glycosyltransferase involved in cell wall biosynthesis
MPVAGELAARLGPDNYRYCLISPSDNRNVRKRTRMGWSCEADEPWILRAGDQTASRREMRQWWRDADIAMCSSRSPLFLRARLKRNKLLFYYSERWWKPPIGMRRLFHPRFLAMALAFRALASSPQFHYLAIGRFAAEDMLRWVSLPGRCWLWGYFTDVPPVWPPPAAPGAEWRILNAGRMLPWKEVGTLIRAFDRVRQCRPNTRLTVIGEGPKRKALERMSGALGPRAEIELLPFQPQAEVWRRMRTSHVYVLPSNGYEGWGAVLNEAMAQGCVVISSDATGGGRTMLRHGENGFLFPPGDWLRLSELLIQLHDDDALRQRLAHAGQDTVRRTWSPGVVADRLLTVCEALLAGRPVPTFGDGPMSAVEETIG